MCISPDKSALAAHLIEPIPCSGGGVAQRSRILPSLRVRRDRHDGQPRRTSAGARQVARLWTRPLPWGRGRAEAQLVVGPIGLEDVVSDDLDLADGCAAGEDVAV